jgi:hypothetical protein
MPTLGAHMQQQRGPVNPPENLWSFIDLGTYAPFRNQWLVQQQQQYYQPGMQVDPRYMAQRHTTMVLQIWRTS